MVILLPNAIQVEVANEAVFIDQLSEKLIEAFEEGSLAGDIGLGQLRAWLRLSADICCVSRGHTPPPTEAQGVVTTTIEGDQ